VDAERASPDELVDAVLCGDREAWQALMTWAFARAEGRCRASEVVSDLPREVAVRVVERLARDDFRALRLYAASADRDDAALARWLAVVVARVRIDVIRSASKVRRVRDGSGRALAVARPVSWDEASLRGSGDVASDAEVLRILDVIASDDFPAAQRRALVAWLRGEDAGEIAQALGLDGPAAARRLLHAARERLRRRLGGDRRNR